MKYTYFVPVLTENKMECENINCEIQNKYNLSRETRLNVRINHTLAILKNMTPFIFLFFNFNFINKLKPICFRPLHVFVFKGD